MFRLVVVCVLLFLPWSIYGQKEASIWYFGLRAGLDFRNGDPTILLDGQLNTMEGVSTISDANGNLLFYTNGNVVYNRQHTIMPNGTGLKGHFSSSQSSIAVPMINDPQRYYLFTVDATDGTREFNYSIINMSLDSGRGDVEIKNIFLESFVCEKLTAVKHCNGTDIWVLVHRFNSSDILAYLVTANGISPTPVVSPAGMFVPSTFSNYAAGCMKVSPDGSKLAIAHLNFGVEVMNFNNSTGVVSAGGSLFLPTPSYGNPKGGYGVEFSPNANYLYVAGDFQLGSTYGNYVFQYDVTLPNIDSIRSSKAIILWKQLPPNTYANFGTLQIAPDNRIYLAEVGSRSLSVINHPNLKDSACGFNYRSLDLQRSSVYGLPNFIQSNFRGSFEYRGNCKADTVFFDYKRSPNEISVRWDFGDPASGINNSSNQDSGKHVYQTSGIFTVTLIRFTACDSDTLTKIVYIGMSEVDLGEDKLLCGVSQFTIIPQVSATNNSFLWHDSSGAPTFSATASGLYWVEVTNRDNGCVKRDSIILSFQSYPEFSLGNDLKKCEGDIVNLSVNVATANYLWSTGSLSSSIQVNQSGEYWVEVNSNGCIKRDTVSLSFHSYPFVNLGSDTTLCEEKTLVLDAHHPGLQYLWQDNSSNQQHSVTTAGLYWVKVSNYGCARYDSIQVNFLDKPSFKLKDTGVCAGMAIELTPDIKKGTDLTFLWNTGSSEKSIRVSQEGNYSLTVSNQCGELTRNLQIGRGRCLLFVPTAFSPNNDGLNDLFRAMHGENVIEFNLQVYNRWGEIVFSTNDKNKGWDGRYKGQIQNGVFIWLIRYKTIAEPAEKIMRGTVMLVR